MLVTEFASIPAFNTRYDFFELVLFNLMQLVQAPQGQIAAGSIRFKSLDYKLDGSGKPIPIWEYELDENGNEALDENGNNSQL